MIYILFVIITSTHNSLAVTQEFNSKETCVAAQKEITRQQAKSTYGVPPTAMFCAAKGEKK